jgi:putative ABC transport system permease protein
MILRHLERRPIKAGLSVLGISLAVSVLVLGNFLNDSLDYLIDFAFYTTQRQDMTINFTEPTSGKALHEIKRLPGVMQAEPFRGVPARIRSANRSRRVGILGLSPEADLNRVMNSDGSIIILPEQGVALSAILGELLEVNVGDLVSIEAMEGRRPIIQQPVIALVDDFSGTGIYMNIDAVRRMMREADTITGAFITADPRELRQLYLQLKRTPRVADVTVQESIVQSFMDTQAENQRRIQSFNIIFAAIIAFGVVYNTARISLAEHSRELATLRVIGFTRREISAILLGELAVLTVAALPVGMLLGRFFAGMVAEAFASEMWRIPLVISRQTYGLAAVVTLIAAILSGLVVRRKLDHLDLIAVLKAKE